MSLALVLYLDRVKALSLLPKRGMGPWSAIDKWRGFCKSRYNCNERISGFLPSHGDIAQLVERTDRTREARGSNPLISN